LETVQDRDVHYVPFPLTLSDCTVICMWHTFLCDFSYSFEAADGTCVEGRVVHACSLETEKVVQFFFQKRPIIKILHCVSK